MKKIAILQSNYIPWKGYFDLIAAVDEFVIYDDAQYTKNDWRNRNQIKTRQGRTWLTIPVLSSKNFGQTIREAKISPTENWAKKHWRSLCQSYTKAECFSEIAELLEPLYLSGLQQLSAVNISFISAICGYLGIKSKISFSWEYELLPGKSERLMAICKQAGANEYVSGPAAKAYLDERLLKKNGIQTSWFNYDDYPEYPQLWGDFTHYVSILDLLFNCGKNSSRYMKFVRP